MLPVVALLGAGCGGINASQSVSPASFLLPGIIKNDPACTNHVPFVLIETSNVVSPNLASVR
jgi:hypothetical protein